MTTTTSPRLAGHVLVEALIAQGVDTAFGVPGESYLAVLDGFHEHRQRIRFIACRQEGGAAFMAEAQGKLSGRPGICSVSFCSSLLQDSEVWSGSYESAASLLSRSISLSDRFDIFFHIGFFC